MSAFCLLVVLIAISVAKVRDLAPCALPKDAPGSIAPDIPPLKVKFHLMSIWFALGIAFLASLNVLTIIVEARRTRQLREWASHNGFTSLGKALPKSIDPKGSGIGGVSSVWNVYERQGDGAHIVLFDCRIGRGKGSSRRTVIAAEASRDVFDTVPLEVGMTVDHQENWQILYRSLVPSYGLRPLMPVDEIKARIRAIRR